MTSPTSSRTFIPVRDDVVSPVRFDARIRVCRLCGQSWAGHAMSIHDFR